MSVDSIARVWQHSQATGSPRLVLLAIADQDRGQGCWASIATLAAMTKLDERNVQRAIGKLLELGEIASAGQRSGGRGKLNVYVLTLPEKGGAGATLSNQNGGAGAGVYPEKGGAPEPKRVAEKVEKGGEKGGASATRSRESESNQTIYPIDRETDRVDEGWKDHPGILKMFRILEHCQPKACTTIPAAITEALAKRYRPAAIEAVLGRMIEVDEVRNGGAYLRRALVHEPEAKIPNYAKIAGTVENDPLVEAWKRRKVQGQ